MAINPATGLEDATYSPPSTPNADTAGLIGAPATVAPPATATTPATTAPTSTTPSTQVYGAPTTQGWNVTADQTVEGRVKGLIDANSPLMQQAATTGLQQANARGLANSSMAIGASQAEVLKAATPIATADANIQANAAQFNAIDPNKQMAIASSEKLAGMNIAADLNRLTTELASRKDLSQADIAARKDQLVTEIMSREKLAEADRTAVAARLDTELASRERIATMENDARFKLADTDNQMKLLIANNQGAASLYDTYQKAVQMINSNDKLDVANKKKALKDQFAILQSGLKMYQDVDGLNLDQILNPPADSAVPGSGGLSETQKNWDVALTALGPRPSPNRFNAGLVADWDAKRAALGPRPA